MLFRSRDALSNDKIHKAVAVLSGAAGDALGEFGKLFAFRLAHILSRDLRPTRVRPVSRTTPVYGITAAHGHWECYGDFHCEESF